jgi:hypothetical protein
MAPLGPPKVMKVRGRKKPQAEAWGQNGDLVPVGATRGDESPIAYRGANRFISKS